MCRTIYRYLFSYSFITVVLLLSGCAATTSQQAMEVPPVSNNIASHGDILLPAELKWDRDKSMAIKTDSFTGGIYQYSGRLEVESLKEFIIASMANNKWKLVGEATYKSTMLAFIKPHKTCMVTLSESFGGFLGKTVVNLYVTVDLAASKGLNPFGEPLN